MKNPYGEYKKNHVLTASKEQVLLMLYEAAIKHCKLAIRYMDEKKIGDKGMQIIKVQDIVSELMVVLDHKVGGDVSLNLEKLYYFMLDKLTEANIQNSPDAVRVVQKLLETLHEGWKGAVESLK